MDYLPLTRSGPFEEFLLPEGIETLFPELAPPAMRSVEVTVCVPEGDGQRCVMDIVTSKAQAPQAFEMAFRACEDWDEFEVTARWFTG
jgi:hypothetical protein